MVTKNRYFKNTLGEFAEVVIASTIDVEETTGTGGTPAVISVPVTIAADPTPGDTIIINVDGVDYLHAVPGGDETTQAAHDAIAALLGANTQGFVVSAHTGTTSSVFQLAWAGSDKNAKAVTLSETGSTFTVAGPYAFAGGTDADAAASDNWKDFVDNSNAGTVWAFWSDLEGAQTVKNKALVAGDTKNPANVNRSFFYGWKDANGKAKRTNDIPVRGLDYNSVVYNAGQVQIEKVKYAGTISVGQIMHLRITETTASIVPYPHWEYSTPVVDTIDNANTALAVLINAEKEEPIVTASASTDTITVTGKYKNRTFKLSAYVEVTGQYPNDVSAITFPTGGTQKAKAPIGDAAAIAELEQYYWIYRGGLNYPQDNTNLSEWQDQTGSNRGAIAQWGILLVSAQKSVPGATANHVAHPYVIVAVPTASVATLAAL